ncbi:nitroreductase [Blastomonas aquatica]|uniref:NADH dehydrogenase n=1 Tax=Blastomonas aquatica TaxID=1510276 RepID=A0ABQ1JBY3_9SPHN|nr:nitroreductase [Blastomonas aquatica]GGB64905.1 NADH dehydrogenase [Blastomonas aquatica]
MNVSEAVATRRSVRQFLPDAVPLETISDILTKAQRSPSGGNTQPWNAIVLTGEPLADLTAKIKAKAAEEPMGAGMEYDIYPKGLEGRYEAQRRAVGEAMFGALGIAREDGAGRVKQMMANWDSFGAPIQIFTYCRTYMGPPQWSDMGMWLQTVMLLLRDAGLDSCPQEIWAMYGSYMRELLGISDDYIFFTGMAVGYRDPEAPINRFPVPRVDLSEAIEFRGF